MSKGFEYKDNLSISVPFVGMVKRINDVWRKKKDALWTRWKKRN